MPKSKKDNQDLNNKENKYINPKRHLKLICLRYQIYVYIHIIIIKNIISKSILLVKLKINSINLESC